MALSTRGIWRGVLLGGNVISAASSLLVNLSQLSMDVVRFHVPVANVRTNLELLAEEVVPK